MQWLTKFLSTWTWDQWKAFGRHVGSYAAGLATAAVVVGVVSQADGATLIQGITQVTDGAGKVVTGFATIFGVLWPIYNSIKAARSASPENQAKQTVKNIENGVSINGEQAKLIKAIADTPVVAEVKLTDPKLAESIPSEKVVS